MSEDVTMGQYAPPETSPETKVDAIQKTVKEAVANSSTKIQNQVIEHLLEVQIDKRVKAILKGIENLKTLADNVKKVKPDTQVFNAEGSLSHEGFSKAKLEELNKAKGEHKKLESALEIAIGQNDFEKLFKHLGV